jgi:hypothetical protein
MLPTSEKESPKTDIESNGDGKLGYENRGHEGENASVDGRNVIKMFVIATGAFIIASDPSLSRHELQSEV